MVLQLGMMGPLGFGVGLVLTVIGIVVGAFFLWLSAKIFRLRDDSFVTPLMITAVAGVVGFVLGIIPIVNMVGWLVAIVLTIWLIHSKYRLDWGKAILVWLVYFALTIVAMLVVAMLFFGSMMLSMMGIS